MREEVLTEGRCLCGDVTYVLTGKPVGMAQCHCKGCQRATGTGHINNAFFKTEQFTVKGELSSHEQKADSGNINRRYFCPKCGSRIYNEVSAKPGIVGVHVGCADDNSWFDPAMVVFCSMRPGWDMTSSDIPNHDTMPQKPKS